MILTQRKYLNHNHFGLQYKTLPIILEQSLTPQKKFFRKVVPLKPDQLPDWWLRPSKLFVPGFTFSAQLSEPGLQSETKTDREQ